MITPLELEKYRIESYDIKPIEAAIDEALKEDCRRLNYHRITLNKHLPKEVAMKVARMYYDNGWNHTYVGWEGGDWEPKTVFILSLKDEQLFNNDENYIKVKQKDTEK